MMIRAITSVVAHVIGLLLLAAPAAAQPAPPRKSVFDGQWSLVFRVATTPGGATINHPTATTRINFSFQAKHPNFEFKDGKFSWEDRENASAHDDSYNVNHFGDWSRTNASHQGIVRASGSGEEESRTLKLTLQWTLGTGQTRAEYNKGSPPWSTATHVMSADGTKVTIIPSPHGQVFTVQQVYTDSTWTLTPASIERQEVGTDAECETVTYKQSRPTTHWVFKTSVTEEIELKQVRYVKLVPRG